MPTIQAIGPLQSRVAIVGEYPSEQDLHKGEPFVGGGGFEFTKMLSEAGLHRESCYITLVCKDRIPRGRVEGLMATKKKDITQAHVLFNGRYVLPELVTYIEQLKAELIRTSPNVVCAVGNLAMWALTGQWGVNEWRSSVMESTLIPGLKVIPTMSPNILFSQWDKRPILVHDLKRVSRQSVSPAITRAQYNFVIRPSFEVAKKYLQDLAIKVAADYLHTGIRTEVAADIETRAGHIACIAFATSEVDAICIPLMCQHNNEGYWSLDEEAELVLLMLNIMREAHIIGQNWNYDNQYIYRHWHFICPNVTDTMIQQHSCFSKLQKNLSFLSSMYLEDHLHWKDDRTNWTTGPKGEGEDKYWIYNCTDTVRTFAVKRVLDNVIIALGMQKVNEFQQSLRPAVLRTMNRGIKMDTIAQSQFSRGLNKAVEEREDWMRYVLDREVNIKSPKQMADLFYGEFAQQEIRKKRADGTLSVTTNDEALSKIADREPLLRGLCRKISELRSLGVFKSTFVEMALDTDKRIRTSFDICGTETYRFSSSKNAFDTGLNCQNIPSGGETQDGGLELPNVRKMFMPDENMDMFDIDLDSADLRIVTWESDCAWMKEHFRKGRKPYIEVMKEYYQNPDMSKKSHPHEYGMFKALCHGTNYLGTAEGIAPRIGLDVKATIEIQKWYYGKCPEIKKWQEEIKKQVKGRRYIENVFGYRCYFFDKIEGTIFNQAVAWIPQSSVGCLINRAYVNIDKNLPQVEVLLQVHDSLMGQFPSLGGDESMAAIVKQSEVPLPYSDPLIIPVGIVRSNKSWGDCR
ncbi:MAG: hypothetical protein K2Q97_01725 [Burkholderiaceae bacterium]|nr:hypothetical protein [Burkholderiaceae bacterium]